MLSPQQYAKPVATIHGRQPVSGAASLMKRESVGCLVVVNDDGISVGIVTDRDLALRVVAEEGLDGTTPVAEVMSHPLISVETDDRMDHVIELMRTRGVRRVPVLSDGRAVGMLALDDLLRLFSRELRDLSLGAQVQTGT